MAGLKVKIGADASEFEKAMKGVKGEVNSLKNTLIGAAAALGVFKVGSAIFNQLGDSLKKASEKAAGMEVLQMNFETLTGSADQAAAMIAEFRKEAQKSPLSTADYAAAGKTLMGFGVEAEDALPVLKMLGDVSMGNADRFGSLALAFAQTTAAGRLMGQEVLQFVNAGFNPLQQISKKTGESMLVLKKRMEAGGISAQEVRGAFESATSAGGMFFEAINKGALTFEGKVAAMKDSMDSLYIAFGSGMNEGLKVGLDAVNSSLPQFQQSFSRIGNIFGQAIGEAVAGDTERFQAIGELIGTYVKVGAMTVFESIGTEIIKKWAQGTQTVHANMWTPGGTLLNDVAGKVLASDIPSTGELFAANMQNATPAIDQLRSRAAASVIGYTPQSAEQYEADRSAVFLESINRQLKEINMKTKPAQTFPN